MSDDLVGRLRALDRVGYSVCADAVEHIEALEDENARQKGTVNQFEASMFARMRDLEDRDRKERIATKTLGWEREANAALTSRIEALESENARRGDGADSPHRAGQHPTARPASLSSTTASIVASVSWREG